MVAKNFSPIDHLLKKPEFSQPAKEAEPIIKPVENTHLREVVEHKMEKEVEPYVSSRAETIELPPDIANAGIQPTVSPKFFSYKNVKLPVSDEKVVKGLHAPITTSFRWLATLAIYILKLAHLNLKIIHGKVVRVIRS